jgi:phage gp29-like protein
MKLPRFLRRAPAPAATAAPSSPPPLARILRPQAATRWLLPQLAAITPQYIEMVLRSALAGDHVRAWELFDLMEDSWPRLKKNAHELKLAACIRTMQLEAWREEGAEPTASARQKQALCSAALRTFRPDPAADENTLRGTLYDVLDAWLKGVSVLEVDWELRALGSHGQAFAPRTTTWVHPVSYAWGADGRLGLRADPPEAPPLTSEVTPFPPEKFLIAIAKSKTGSPLGTALLRPLAWWWCAANFSAEWLLNLAQTFGLPFRWANYDRQAPPAVVDAICSMLQNMGSAGWAAFPAGTDLELKAEGMKSGRDTPQGDMLDRADRQCDLLILGQTLTSDSGGMGHGGGSFALGQVHADIQAGLVQAAADFAAGVLQDQLLPALLRLNYGDDSECPSLALRVVQEEDLTQKAAIIQSLAAAGAQSIIGLDWLGKTFGIPKPAAGEATLPTLSTQTPQTIHTI